MDIKKLYEYLDPEQDDFERFCKNFLQDLSTKYSQLKELRDKRSVESVNVEYLNRIDKKIGDLIDILMVVV